MRSGTASRCLRSGYERDGLDENVDDVTLDDPRLEVFRGRQHPRFSQPQQGHKMRKGITRTLGMPNLWWRGGGSNSRPRGYESRALTI